MPVQGEAPASVCRIQYCGGTGEVPSLWRAYCPAIGRLHHSLPYMEMMDDQVVAWTS